MASEGISPFNDLQDRTEISPGYDEFDDMLDFKDTLNFDDEPVFDDSWRLQDTPPYESGLYSTPLSWEAPQTRLPLQQPMRDNVYTTSTSTLTAEQQEQLRSIAMPDHLQFQNPSPHSMTSTYKSGSVSSPDQQTISRKRKTSDDEDEGDEGEGGAHPPVKKTAHNMIEKRYRTNLNDKIAALRDSVPSLRVMSKSARGEDTSGDKEDLQGLTPAHKLNKATVLAKATEYIRHLEKRNTRLTDENTSMKARIAAFEKLFMSGSMGLSNPIPSGNSTTYPQEPYVTSPSHGQMTPGVSPPGMIDVPDDFRRLHAASQMDRQTYPIPPQGYQPVYRQQNGNGWPNTGGYLGKMMVGSLAGLMILEGFSETEQDATDPSGRGLFALPTQLLGNVSRYLKTHSDISVLGYHSSAGETWAFLRLFLVVGTLLYVFVPSLFVQKPKQNGKQGASKVLAAAPAPASSIQVRRQAWLTAVQTVWVPRHNFFLEAAALCLKMFKLSIRNAIGWYGYALLTGITEQQEAARVKAWGIALDAQLAGGDVEVSKSRLILTLMASGTLPDTPARLMLKSIHVRILLWEFGNSGFNGFYMFQEFAAKLSRWKWNEAKKLQQLLLAQADSRPQDYEPLPTHLATLLEQECDDVLVDSIGQRAYNLCWNLPTTQNLIGPGDGMDSVVDDFAVRSPLDAVAAWWSSLVLHRAFASSLEGDEGGSIMKDVDLASDTAPLGSGVQLRALVARAVLIDEKRGANIASALQLLSPIEEKTSSSVQDHAELTPTPEETSKRQAKEHSLINTTTSTASLPDLQMALDCAKAIGHLRRSASAPAAYPIINSLKLTNLSLLGFSAAYKLMEALFENEEAALSCSRALENLAGSLRIWIGGAEGLESGLSKQTKEAVVERCIGITKKLIGMERDAGYESMSDQDAELGDRC